MNGRGFAILEVLIATIILVAGLLAVMSFLSSALRVAAEAQTRAVATALAESRLQELQGYLQVAGSAVSSAGNGCDDPLIDVASSAIFSRCWWVDDSRALLPSFDPQSSCTEGDGMDERACWISATVDVSWVDRQGDLQNVTLLSILNVLAPQRGALELMALMTREQQPMLLPEWLFATEVVEELSPDEAADTDHGGAVGAMPELPGDGLFPPAMCPSWLDLDDQLPPVVEFPYEC